jgi:endonuclease/exonuclease/phosphatase family metal-dependent hydrolase
VVTWNLWWRFGPWEARQAGIRAVLGSLGADVVCLQEVYADAAAGDDQAHDLAAALGLHLARTCDREGRALSFGTAILSRWPLADIVTVRLPRHDGGPSARAAVVARVERPGSAFSLASVHLTWQYHASRERERQLDVIVAELARRQRDDGLDHPPVLAGDLNAVPESDEVRRLTGLAEPYQPDLVFTDCWAAVGDGPGHTWTRDNPHTADAQFPRRRLDHVLVGWPRPKPLANPLRASLAGIDEVDGVVPSDHYAVVVDLDDRRSAP